MSELVYVELDAIGPIRIFRTDGAALSSSAKVAGRVEQWTLAHATDKIRRRILERDRWRCQHCGNLLTWKTAHMHERQARGKILLIEENVWRGGEVSLANSISLCYSCHMEDDNAHGKRRPQFGPTNAQM